MNSRLQLITLLSLSLVGGVAEAGSRTRAVVKKLRRTPGKTESVSAMTMSGTANYRATYDGGRIVVRKEKMTHFRLPRSGADGIGAPTLASGTRRGASTSAHPAHAEAAQAWLAGRMDPMGDLYIGIGAKVTTADGSTHTVAPVWRNLNPTLEVSTTKTKNLAQGADGRFRSVRPTTRATR